MIVFGNASIIFRRLLLISISSQSKTPCGNDPWVKAARKAVEYAVDSNLVVITSIGLHQWELLIYLCSLAGGNQLIVAPDFGSEGADVLFDKLVADFDLDIDKTAVIFAEEAIRKSRPKANWESRDQVAFGFAGTIIPVSVRPRGRFEKRLKDLPRGKIIIDNFRVDYAKPVYSAPKYDNSIPIPQIEEFDHLTHWTRTCHGPWPGQNKRQYYESVLNSGNEYPNDAFSALRRIAGEKLIRGSSKRIRDNINVVGLTESSPDEVISSLRWLPKRTGWNFEPYGIAIKRSYAERLGIRKAIYGDSRIYDSLSEADRPYFQSSGGEDTDWSIEKEWRAVGDIDFSSVPPEDIIYFVWKSSEICKLREVVSRDSKIISMS